ncbi:MAG TPA: S24 family peptidase [Candidatus Paceibacterota bacterium]|jgi:DNA polymerase V|nr:S24 family peptidase [Candidatus Paceibacterota bacterium]
MPFIPFDVGNGQDRENGYVPSLDLNDFIVRHPEATFFATALGSAMEALGIADGDLLVIDRIAEPSLGKIVVTTQEGEFLLRRFDENTARLAEPESPFAIWGTVIGIIRRF